MLGIRQQFRIRRAATGVLTDTDERSSAADADKGRLVGLRGESVPASAADAAPAAATDSP